MKDRAERISKKAVKRDGQMVNVVEKIRNVENIIRRSKICQTNVIERENRNMLYKQHSLSKWKIQR